MSDQKKVSTVEAGIQDLNVTERGERVREMDIEDEEQLQPYIEEEENIAILGGPEAGQENNAPIQNEEGIRRRGYRAGRIVQERQQARQHQQAQNVFEMLQALYTVTQRPYLYGRLRGRRGERRSPMNRGVRPPRGSMGPVPRRFDNN